MKFHFAVFQQVLETLVKVKVKGYGLHVHTKSLFHNKCTKISHLFWAFLRGSRAQRRPASQGSIPFVRFTVFLTEQLIQRVQVDGELILTSGRPAPHVVPPFHLLFGDALPVQLPEPASADCVSPAEQRAQRRRRGRRRRWWRRRRRRRGCYRRWQRGDQRWMRVHGCHFHSGSCIDGEAGLYSM